MVRLKWVTIHEFRSVEPGTHIEFADGHSFLLGKNGTGKTTLLDLLAALVSGDLGWLRLVGQPLDVEWCIEGPAALHAEGGWRVEVSLRAAPGARPKLPFGPESTNASGVHLEWTAKVRSTVFGLADPMTWTWSSAGTGVIAGVPEIAGTAAVPNNVFEEGLWWALWHDIVHRYQQSSPSIEGSVDPRAARMIVLTGSASRRFDEALDRFAALVDAAHLEIGSPLWRPGGKGVLASGAPPDLSLALLSAGRGSEMSALAVSPHTSPASPIAQFAVLIGGVELWIRPRLVRSDPTGETLWRQIDAWVEWADGSRHSHTELSFGQKRLLAFLWHADLSADSPVFTDELANGMHTDWLRAIVDLLGDRQGIHAVQNPLLVDKVGPGTVEEVRKRFVLCSVEVLDGRRRWRWRNPTAEEAADIRSAWDAGFQQLSEILYARGCW